MDIYDRCRARAVPFAQGSVGWLASRAGMLTASDVGAALGMNPHCTRTELARFKSGLEKRVVDTYFTSHGNKYEFEAGERYLLETGRSAFTVGLAVHPVYTWLGASPDLVTNCGRLVEIKVPVRRLFEAGEPIPSYYWAQMQLQMEVLDIDVCDFVQYRARTKALRIDVVERDRQWFSDSVHSLSSFMGKILDIRADHERQAWEAFECFDKCPCAIP